MEITEIRERLKGMNVREVATATKLARQTIYNAMNDKAAIPTPATMKLLKDYIALCERREVAKARIRKDTPCG